jgi:hypothetical protein
LKSPNFSESSDILYIFLRLHTGELVFSTGRGAGGMGPVRRTRAGVLERLWHLGSTEFENLIFQRGGQSLLHVVCLYGLYFLFRNFQYPILP